jgi:hypothetical protein
MVALRTYLENEVHAAHEFVIFSKRSQKSTFLVFADQEFFQAENPLASRQSSYGENGREWPEPCSPASNPCFSSRHKVQSDQKRSVGQAEASTAPVVGRIANP